MAFGADKDAKKEAKVQALLEKYGVQDLTDPRDKQAVHNIANALMGNKLIELGAALTGNGIDAAKMSYMNAIMEQNFIIIRLLDRIANK